MLSSAEATKAGQGSISGEEPRPRTRIVFEARWVAGESEPHADYRLRGSDRPEDDKDAPDWWKEER